MRRAFTAVVCLALAATCGYPAPADVGGDGGTDGGGRSDANGSDGGIRPDAAPDAPPASVALTDIGFLLDENKGAVPHDLAIEIGSDGTHVTAIGFGVQTTLALHFTAPPGAVVKIGADTLTSGVTREPFASARTVIVTNQGATAMYTVKLVDRAFTEQAQQEGKAGQLAVAVGDIDGDGRDDIAVAASTSGTLTVYLTSGGAGSGAIVLTPTTYNALGANGVALADINQDGRLDVVTTGQSSGSGVVTVFLNTLVQGKEQLQVGQVFATKSINGLVLGNFTADSAPDLVLFSGSTVFASVNNTVKGSNVASFPAPAIVGSSSTLSAVAAANLDADSLADLVLGQGGQSTGSITILHNQSVGGAIAFGSGTETVTTSAPVRGLVPGDFNHDGRTDLAVSTTGNLFGVLVNDAVGVHFESVATSAKVLAVCPADFDSDGQLDIGVARLNSTGSGAVIAAYIAVPAGSLGATAFQETPSTNLMLPALQAIATGDFDGDGVPDVVIISDDGSGSISLIRTR